MQKKVKVLVLGIGNPGRGDDGLGQRLVDNLEKGGAEAADVGYRYQLNVEDALAIRDYEVVVFSDAATTGETPATLTEIEPSQTVSFSTHEMTPASVLALCQELYGRSPRAYVLAVRGYEWTIGERLSARAERNLGRALEILRGFLEEISAGLIC